MCMRSICDVVIECWSTGITTLLQILRGAGNQGAGASLLPEGSYHISVHMPVLPFPTPFLGLGEGKDAIFEFLPLL